MMNLFNISGKKAIVTGGGRGLGKGMAQTLHDAGVEVVLMGTNENVLHTAEAMTSGEVPVHGVICNFKDTSKVEDGFQAALELLEGRIDILVNNAGMQIRHKCEEFPLEDWQAIINVNLTATFLMCQCAGREMLKQKSGKIVNIASMLSFTGGFNVPAYAASKGGVAQITKSFTNEWASYGINVNAIAPGYMSTDNTAALRADETRNRQILERIPAGRWGMPEDLSGALLFLCSHASDYLHGVILPVDGGFMVR